MLPRYPGDSLVIREMRIATGARVTLLGRGGVLEWRARGADVVVSMPRIRDGELPFDGPRTLKIEPSAP
jgi:hypothetical protein